MSAIEARLSAPRLRRPTFPRLSRKEMRRANLAAAATGTLTFNLGSSPVLAQLPEPRPATYDWRIDVELDRHPLAFHCSNKALARMLWALDPALALGPAPPASLAGLLIDVLLHPVLPVWERALGFPLRFASIHPDRTPPQHGSLAVQFSVAGEAFPAALVGEEAIDRILARWPANPHALTNIRLPAHLWLGATELPFEIARTLQPGDGVIVETGRPAAMPLRVGETWGAPTRKQGNDIVLLEPPGPAPARSSGMSAGQSTTVETLPVRLEFNVGHHQASIAELRTLQAGSILSLNRTALELVEITVNGLRVGTGELVDVEGAMTVRITKLFGLD